MGQCKKCGHIGNDPYECGCIPLPADEYDESFHIGDVGTRVIVRTERGQPFGVIKELPYRDPAGVWYLVLLDDDREIAVRAEEMEVTVLQ